MTNSLKKISEMSDAEYKTAKAAAIKIFPTLAVDDGLAGHPNGRLLSVKTLSDADYGIAKATILNRTK